MEQSTANRLVEESLSAIYGFALSRLGKRDAAEELVSDIVWAVLSHAHQVRDERARYGWLWQIAHNCLAARYRGERQGDLALDETIPDGGRSPEEALILREDLGRLRRELALLSEAGRRATVLYYMDELSCAEVASQLQTSVEMVKYHLFRARNLMREGMQMERIYGEKSYRPEAFEIDFYGTHGGDDGEYRAFAQRRLRGNILLATYYTPMRLPELSLELGVATPYLEDELVLLIRRKYLIERQGKYVTNIPIFTSACRAEINRAIGDAVDRAARAFAEADLAAFAEQFGGRMANPGHLRWQALLLASHFALLEDEHSSRPLPENEVYALVNRGGGRGYVWGRSDDGERKIAHDVEGIYNGYPDRNRRVSMIAINFGENLSAGRVESGSVEGLAASAETDTPSCPVYTQAEYAILRQQLDGQITVLRDLFGVVTETASRICGEHAPAHIREPAREVGGFVHCHSGLARLATALCRDGHLTPTTEPGTPLPTVCLVRNQ